MKINKPAWDYEQALLQFNRNTKASLNDLLEKSGLDIEENQRLVSVYHDCVKDAKDTSDIIRSLRSKRFSLILQAVALVAVGIYLIYSGSAVLTNTLTGNDMEIFICVLRISAGLASACTAIIPIRKVRHEIIHSLKDMQIIQQELNHKVSEAENVCRENIRPFLDLLYDELTAEIINKTLEDIYIDPYFTEDRADIFAQCNPELFAQNRDFSTMEIISGNSRNTPFIIRKYLSHYMGTCTYTGERTIEANSWEIDSDGRRIYRVKPETLTETITMPKPFYYTGTDIHYAWGNLPNLHFSHEAQPELMKNPDRRSSLVELRNKKLNTKHRKQVKEHARSNAITPMSNTLFEGLFAAFDRDNEMEFRMMFTPKAQENIVDLINSDLFGDYFHFFKTGKITRIEPAESLQWDMDTSSTRYKGFDYNEILSQVIEYNQSFFTSFYKMIAPVLCIPIYNESSALTDRQANKQIYSSMRPSEYMAEVLANKIGSEAILGKHINMIVTASKMTPDDLSDKYSLDIFYYNEIPRIYSVQKKASNNKWYDIDIPWTEYIPCHKYMTIRIYPSENSKDESFTLSQTEGFPEGHDHPHTCRQTLFGYIEDPVNL